MSPLLCPDCRRYVGRDRLWCSACGRALADDAPPLELVLEDGTRVPLTETVTIGRAEGNRIRLSDPSVSRLHARILEPGPAQGPTLTDAGSAFGTWVDEQRVEGSSVLHDGASIRVGDSRLTVERRRGTAEAGRTIFGGSRLAGGAAARPPRVQLPAGESRPSVRAGWALKRLEAADPEHHWVLRDLGGGAALRLGDAEAEMFRLVDGKRSLAELIEEAERRYGPKGLAVLAALLAALAEHGLLAGGEDSRLADRTRWRSRLLTPRVFCVPSAGALLARTYGGGAWRLFTRSGFATLAAVALAGAAALVALVAGSDATPFVVTGNLSLGALVFILGRLLVALLHELAHGWTLVAFGRTPGRCGVKFMLGFPYAFVDTSGALFEPRRHRIAVSGSGPAADLTVGGAFAVACLLSPHGVAHDIAFQIALAAYVGALLNLNPLLERDGYHILGDWLRVPNLRGRAREWLVAGGDLGARAVGWYAAASVVWSLLIAAIVVFLSLRYADELLALAPSGLVWTVLAGCWTLVLLPVVAAVVPPLLRRVRRPQEATS